MILDGQLVFDASGTTITTTATSTNVIDLSVARDLGIGDNPALKLAITVGTAFTSTAAATLQIQVQGSTDNSNFTTMAESRAYAIADLVAGTKLFPIDLPAVGGVQAIPRYLRLNYVGGTATFTTGKLSAYLVLDRQDAMPPAYPAGINILN